MVARVAATSAAAIGWKSAGETRTVCPTVPSSAMLPKKLEELGGMENRVGDGRFLDQVFLRHLRTEIAVLLETVSPHNRQRDVMGDAGLHFSGDDMTA